MDDSTRLQPLSSRRRATPMSVRSAFTATGTDEKSARCLNHACVANCEAVESNGRVHIHAVLDIKPGEELFISYGLSVEGRL